MSGQHCENYDVKRETVHSYPRNVDRCCWNLSALLKICFRFVLLYNKSLNDWSPSGPVIKCLRVSVSKNQI